MKRILTVLLLAISAQGADWTPTQTDLQTTLSHAAKAWGLDGEVRAIRLDRLNDCGRGDAAALTTFADRSITINSACKWSRYGLLLAVMHEYGHILAGDAVHSPDEKSIMFYQLRRRQRVTADNLSYIAWQAEERAVRPTILSGDD